MILGAGPCGLAAAHRLQEAGHRVLLLERESYLGGMGTTLKRGDYLFDFGPHAFHAKPGRAVPLVRELMGEELLRGEADVKLFLKNRFFQYPLSIPEMLLKLNPLFTARIAVDFLAVSLLYQLVYAHNENFESWGVQRFGKTLYNLSFGLYSGKVWGIPPNQISPIFARGKLIVPGLRALVKKLLYAKQKNELYWREYLYPQKGSGQIYEKLAGRIQARGGEILRNTRVGKIARQNGSVESVSFEHQGRLQTIPVQALISTTTLPELFDLLRPPVEDFGLYTASRIRFRSVRFLYVALKSRHLFPFHWVYLVDERFRFNRVSEIKNMSGALCPEDETVLCLEISCDPGDRFWECPDEELLRVALEDLKRLRRGIDKIPVVDHWTRRLERAYNIYDLGFERQLDVLFFYLSRFDNLATAGRRGLFLQNDMHDSMAMGFAAADAWIHQGHFRGIYRHHLDPFIRWRNG